MKPRLTQPPAVRQRARAFSLLEVMVAVGLLTVVILALYAMFDQTQKAMRQNVAQTDVSEAGRAALDFLVRDLERARAFGFADITNNVVIRRTYPDTRLKEFEDDFSRDTTFHELFMLTRPELGHGSALGFFVANETNAQQQVDNYVGTLYRYEPTEEQHAGHVPLRGPQVDKTGNINSTNLNNLWRRFAVNHDNFRSDPTQVARLLDGVVFFRVLAYGQNGLPIDRTTRLEDVPQDVVNFFILPGGDNLTTFGNAALPAALEVEFGTLPPRLLTQFRSLPNENLKASFLRRNLANVLVFRQRVALRTALQ